MFQGEQGLPGSPGPDGPPGPMVSDDPKGLQAVVEGGVGEENSDPSAPSCRDPQDSPASKEILAPKGKR